MSIPTRSCPRTRRAVTTVFVVAGSFFVLTNLANLQASAAALGNVAVLPLIAGGVVSALAVVNRGLMHRGAHRSVGLDVTPQSMVITAGIGFTANKLVKSGGACGLAVFLRNAKRNGHSGAAVAAACVLASAGSLIAFSGLVAASVVLLAVTEGLNGWWIAIAIWAGVQAIAVSVVVAVALRSHRSASWMWHRGQRTRRWCGRRRLLRRWGGTTAAPDESSLAALLGALSNARANHRALAGVVAHAFASKVFGAFMLAAAIRATGLGLSFTEVLTVYSLALAASSVSIAPGGIGVVEASTAALLMTHGASAPAAAVAVSLFRVFDLWLPVAFGAVVGRRELRPNARLAESRVAAAGVLPLRTRLPYSLDAPTP